MSTHFLSSPTKKGVSLGLVVILATVMLLPAVEVRAQVPVWAPETDVILGGMATNDLEQTYFDQVLTLVAVETGRTIIQSMTRSMVNWINSGYDGSPAFSQNLNRDLRQLGDAVASGFLSDIITAGFDSGFISPLAMDVVAGYYLMTSEDDMLAQRLRYTLADHTQNSVAYMRGSWPDGGLSGWHALTFQCGNNPTCSSLVLRETLINRIDAHVKKQLADYNAGRGFLSWPGECKKEKTTLSDQKRCISADVLTPGSVVEQQLQQITGSDLSQLQLADSINEIIGAAVSQLVGQVLGPGGLLGASQPSNSGGGRAVNRGTPPAPAFDAQLFAGFRANVNADVQKAEQVGTSWQSIKAAATQANAVCTANLQDNSSNASRIAQISAISERADTAIARATDAGRILNTTIALIDRVETTTNTTVKATLAQQAQSDYRDHLGSDARIYDEEVAEATRESSSQNQFSLVSLLQELEDECD